MRKTDFLKLHLPDENEYYNVELDQNQNFIRVDGKLKEHDTALTTIQQGATNEQKGIVQFGIEEGKALEGNMLARLAGAYGFGGDIQTPGVKNQNYIYYDNNTRKMYKCLNQNSDTSANVQNYVPIDNFSFLERLENLNKYLQYVVRYNSAITFEKNDIGASITSDALGIRLARNHRVLVIASASTGNNSHGLGIFPNSEKSFSTSNCGFSFYPQANSRITCTYILENTDTIYVRALSMRSPYTHPQFITQYLDRPENDILVNCILLD